MNTPSHHACRVQAVSIVNNTKECCVSGPAEALTELKSLIQAVSFLPSSCCFPSPQSTTNTPSFILNNNLECHLRGRVGSRHSARHALEESSPECTLSEGWGRNLPVFDLASTTSRTRVPHHSVSFFFKKKLKGPRPSLAHSSHMSTLRVVWHRC